MGTLGDDKAFFFMLKVRKNIHQYLDNAKIRNLVFMESSDEGIDNMNQPFLGGNRKKEIFQEVRSLKGKSRFLFP